MAAESLRKRCPKCKRRRPKVEFGPNRSAHDGLNSYCRPCARQVGTDYYRNNRERCLSTQKRYHCNQPAQRKINDLKAKYGLTADQYDELVRSQGNACAVCGKRRPGESSARGWFHVDHDHQTGKVRGLLCCHCNWGLGNFGDSEDTLQKAIEYLRNHGR